MSHEPHSPAETPPRPSVLTIGCVLAWMGSLVTVLGGLATLAMVGYGLVDTTAGWIAFGSEAMIVAMVAAGIAALNLGLFAAIATLCLFFAVPGARWALAAITALVLGLGLLLASVSVWALGVATVLVAAVVLVFTTPSSAWLQDRAQARAAHRGI